MQRGGQMPRSIRWSVWLACVLVTVADIPMLAQGAQKGPTAQEERPLVQMVSTLQTKDLLVLPYGSGVTFLPGASGEFYAQMSTGPDFQGARILRKSFSGDESVALDVSALAQTGKIPAHGYYLMDFAVDPRGGLVAVIAWGEKRWIVDHDAVLDVDGDGDVRTYFELSDGFSPYKAVAFFSGNYLLEGRNLKEPQSTLRLQIRDFRGDIVVPDLHLFSAPSGSAAKAGGSTAKGGPFEDDDGGVPPGVSPAFAMASTDNNFVYAYSVRSPNVLEKISDTGKCEEIAMAKLPLPPDEEMRPIDMYAAHGQILLHLAAFSTKPPDPAKGTVAEKHYWAAYETTDNTLFATYASDSDVWTARSLLVGYEPGSFYFVEGHRRGDLNDYAFSLLHATPK
jgi:hypothetical protein